MAKATVQKKAPGERWALPAKQARSQATRARILEAAEQVFAEQGYEGARMADIAAVAGVSVGAAYFRFKDKDALFFAIAESFATDVREGLPMLHSLGTHSDAQAIVDGFVEGAAANFRTHRGLFRAIVERGFEHPHAMDVMFAIREEMAEALKKALRESIAGRELSFAVRMMTQIVYGFLLTGVLNKQAPTRIDDSRTIRELKKALLAYVQQAGRTP